jgi:hypothetical protein
MGRLKRITSEAAVCIDNYLAEVQQTASEAASHAFLSELAQKEAAAVAAESIVPLLE